MGTDRFSLKANSMEGAMVQAEESFWPRIREELQAHGFKAEQSLRDYSLFLLNGHSVDRQNLWQVKLKAGDILHIFPLAMGG